MREDIPAAPPATGTTDAHLHLWNLDGPGYGWLEGAPAALRRSATWEEAAPQLTALDVTRAVLVQADDTLADTQAMQAAAARIEADDTPIRRADVVAWLPLEQPAQLAELLADPSALTHVVGVRQLIHDHPDPGYLDRPAVRESLARLAAAGLPLDVPDAYPRHLVQAAEVADAVEGLVIVLDHLGKPPFGDGEAMGRWERQLRDLSHRPHTVAKLSGLATSGIGAEQAPHDLRRAVDVALEHFGPERLLWGSDWPIAPQPFDLAAGTTALRDLIGQLELIEQTQILRGTAERIYRRVGD